MKKSIFVFLVSVLSFMQSSAQTKPAFPDKMNLTENVNIAGISSGEIAKEVLLSSNGLSLSDKSSACQITSFRMTLVTNGAEPREFFNEVNGSLTPRMQDAIKHASSGSKLFFEYIKCATSKNAIRTLLPGNFILK